jgi:hypothetical protein
MKNLLLFLIVLSQKWRICSFYFEVFLFSNTDQNWFESQRMTGLGWGCGRQSVLTEWEFEEMKLACSVCISDSVDGRIIWVIRRSCLRVCSCGTPNLEINGSWRCVASLGQW